MGQYDVVDVTMSTKVWIGDFLALVDDPVADELERLNDMEIKNELIKRLEECLADMVFRCADNGIAIDDIFGKHGITLE